MVKVLIDGKEVNAESVETLDNGLIKVTIVDHDKKTKVITDSSIRDIKIVKK